jgi:hypothetical protein
MSKSTINVIGVVFGLAAVCIVVVSLLLILDQRGLTLPGMFRGDFRESFGAGRVQEEGEESVREAVESVLVANVAGRIDVSGWGEDYALVKWVKSGPSRGDLERLQVIVEKKGRELTVRRVSNRPRGARGSVSFEIFLPEGIRDLTLKSVSGSVALREVSSGINQRIETVSGSIETDNAADLDITSVSGSVNFVFSGKRLRVKTVSGRIEGNVAPADFSGSARITSVSGIVDIEVPADLDATLNLHSTSGSISTELDLELTESKRNRLRGTAGRGTMPFEVGTTSGSIRLDTF